MYTFTEEELEQAALEWLQEKGYAVLFGPDIAPDGSIPERRDYSDVVLLDRLRDALGLINPHLPSEAIEGLYAKSPSPRARTFWSITGPSKK